MPGKRRGGRFVESSPRFMDAILAHEAREQAEAAPIVKAGCTCRNGHEPIDGLIYENPCCVEHGRRTRWPSGISLSSAESGRTLGTIHNPRRTQ